MIFDVERLTVDVGDDPGPERPPAPFTKPLLPSDYRELERPCERPDRAEWEGEVT